MRMLITGAGGMLGTDLQTAATTAGHDVIALARAELDIADRGAVADAVTDARAEIVVNCAAWTDVDGAESEPDAAAAANATGPGALAAAASVAGAWTVHVSTDYVFDGTKRTAYVESDPTNPLSQYGRSKLDGELAVAAAAPESHTIVRTAWLFGVHGRCFPQTMLRRAADRDELTVVDDQIGCPTFTGHLAAALVTISEQRDRPLGVLHLAAAGECSWRRFAEAILADSPHGATTTVTPITTAQFPTAAPRPAYSVLRSERGAPTLPDWRDGLRAFVAERAPVMR
jgi:dTDP-4-dehydrorhamnose reductase